MFPKEKKALKWLKPNHEKKLFSLIMLIFSVLLFPLKSAAVINLPEGFLIGDNQGVTVTKSGGYFFKLNDLFPGDTVTRKLTIKNTSNEGYTLKMYIEPIDSKGPANLLQTIEMELTYNEQLIFDGNLVNQDKGVVDKGTEIDFGIIPEKSQSCIDIQLDVLYDVPWEDFVKDESKADVRWVFVAERNRTTVPPIPPTENKVPPTSPSAKSPGPSSTPKVRSTKNFPQTGERRAIVLTVIGLILVGVTWMMYYLWYKKDKKKQPAN